MTIKRSSITSKQLEVIKLIDKGLTSYEIGLEMGIRENTVKSHRQTAMGLLGVNNAGDLVRVCKEENLIE